MPQKTYNVTNLTQEQRRELFAQCITQEGFKAFIKNQNNKQTHYTFQYKNYRGTNEALGSSQARSNILLT